jgi:hypothetical protein
MQNNFAIIVLTSLLIGLAGCGEGGSNPGGGSVGWGQGLRVSPDASVTTANYTVSGPSGLARSGTVAVGDSPDVPVVLSPLPVARGYELELSATASDGVTTCGGSTTFDVTNSTATNTVVVHLECAAKGGNARVRTSTNVCPVLEGLSASPLALSVGGAAKLQVAASDSNNGPAGLVYAWAVNGVRLSRQNASTLSYTCTALGQVTISATVSDGDPKCTESASVQVSCE